MAFLSASNQMQHLESQLQITNSTIIELNACKARLEDQMKALKLGKSKSTFTINLQSSPATREHQAFASPGRVHWHVSQSAESTSDVL